MQNALASLLRHLAIGTITGGFVGAIAGGLGSRIAMRITAQMTTENLQGRLTEAQARVGEITTEGTIFLLFFATVLGIYGGLLYRIAAKWLPGKTALRGLGFGLLLLLLHGSLLIEGDNFDFTLFGSPIINIAMFALLPVIFGIIVSYTEAWLERVYPTFAFRPKPLLLYLPGIFGGIFLFALTISAIQALNPRPGDGLFINPAQAWIVLMMVAVIVISIIFDPMMKQQRYAIYLKALLLGIPAIYGGMLLYASIREIMMGSSQ